MANQAEFRETKFSVGDTVDVHHKVKEGKKERSQTFTGVVIAIKGHPPNKSFTVRKIAVGSIGVERIWPLACPSISKIEVKRKGKVKRAKLYYLRQRKGKLALKIKELRPKIKASPRKDKKKETLRSQKKTEDTERKSQRSQQTSVSSVSKKSIRVSKTKARKTRRNPSQKTSPK